MLIGLTMWQWVVFYDFVNEYFHLKYLGRVLGTTNFLVATLGLLVYPCEGVANGWGLNNWEKKDRFFLVNGVLTLLEIVCVVFPYMLTNYLESTKMEYDFIMVESPFRKCSCKHCAEMDNREAFLPALVCRFSKQWSPWKTSYHYVRFETATFEKYKYCTKKREGGRLVVEKDPDADDAVSLMCAALKLYSIEQGSRWHVCVHLLIRTRRAMACVESP